MRISIPPILFFILSLLLFGGIHTFYMVNHKRIFGDYVTLVSSHDKRANLFFSVTFSIFLFLTPLLLVDDLYFWISGQAWPEGGIPRWIFSTTYGLQYLGIATFLGFREYQKRLKK